jgi:hypothetical protein
MSFMLSVAFSYCYAECRYAECRVALSSHHIIGLFKLSLFNLRMIVISFKVSALYPITSIARPVVPSSYNGVNQPEFLKKLFFS